MTKLLVIPQPEEGTRSVLAYEGEGTVAIRNPERETPVHTCGACEAPLIVGMGLAQLQNVVLRCNGCGAYNETIPGPGGPGVN
jgi:hypothetical protein